MERKIVRGYKDDRGVIRSSSLSKSSDDLRPEASSKDSFPARASWILLLVY